MPSDAWWEEGHSPVNRQIPVKTLPSHTPYVGCNEHQVALFNNLFAQWNDRTRYLWTMCGWYACICCLHSSLARFHILMSSACHLHVVCGEISRDLRPKLTLELKNRDSSAKNSSRDVNSCIDYTMPCSLSHPKTMRLKTIMLALVEMVFHQHLWYLGFCAASWV